MNGRVEKALANGWAAFVENKGQWDDRALYLSRTPGANVWITSEGPVFDFNRFVPMRRDAPRRSDTRERAGYTVGHVVRMSFVNARPSAVTGGGELGCKYNFLIGSDRSKWVANARGFSEVVAEQPYDGVSVRYSIDKGSPRYDVIVAPGADPSQVGMKIEGAYGAQVLANGNLRIRTSLGDIEERGLKAFQTTGSGQSRIPCRMVLDGDVVRFDMGSYDRTKTLVIDPLVYSTYFGGTGGGDIPNGIATNSSNDIYVAGSSSSINFPTTVGAYQRTHKTPFVSSAYVSEMNPQESALIFSTLVGGSNFDGALGLAVDQSRNVYITGFSESSDYPTTAGAFQKTNNEAINGNPTTFITKLNATGSALLYSTFLGGSGDQGGGEAGEKIAVDAAGNAFVCGYTFSSNFPVTSGAFQKTNRESATGACTGYLTKVNATGTALLYSTYFGGSGDGSFADGDACLCLAVDPSDNAFVGGSTFSGDLPVSATAFQKKNNASANKAACGFVAKVSSTGSAVGYCTYLGGSLGTKVFALALDSHQDAAVAGATLSTDFPVTPGAYMVWDPEAGSTAFSPTSAFVTKLNASGSAAFYSTYLGGSGGGDAALDIRLDSVGNAFVAGQTGSADFPTTAGAFETVGADQGNGFMTVLNNYGTSLIYSTFLGGAGDIGGAGSECTGIAINELSQVVVAGGTDSDTFPTTNGALNPLPTAGFVSTLSVPAAKETIAGFSISPNVLTCGNQAKGTISLNNSVATDTVISLTATGPASIPSEVTIAAGTATATFTVRTLGVNTVTMLSIKATAGALAATATATVNLATLASITFNQNSVIQGHAVSATISLNGVAGPPSTTVKLSSNSAEVVVAPSVSIPFGSFSARTTVNTKPVSAATTATVTATLGSGTVTKSLVVEPAQVASLTVPATCVGGATVTGTVTLSGPAGPTGDVVNLASSSADATVPKTVTVPAGATSVTFSITTKGVTSTVPAVITATFAGTSRSATLLVEK